MLVQRLLSARTFSMPLSISAYRHVIQHMTFPRYRHCVKRKISDYYYLTRKLLPKSAMLLESFNVLSIFFGQI